MDNFQLNHPRDMFPTRRLYVKVQDQNLLNQSKSSCQKPMEKEKTQVLWNLEAFLREQSQGMMAIGFDVLYQNTDNFQFK